MADNEWKTVPMKKEKVKETPAAYVAPHARTAAQKKAAVEDAVDFKSQTAFPSLGGSVKRAAWGGESSFSQKVKDLIEQDKQSALEREAAEEARRNLVGWQTLRFGGTAAAFSERFSQLDAAADEQQRLRDLGLWTPFKPRAPSTLVAPTDYIPMEDAYESESEQESFPGQTEDE
jgi:hypothetical protein